MRPDVTIAWAVPRREGKLVRAIALLVGLLAASLVFPSMTLASSIERPYQGWFRTTESLPLEPPAGCLLYLRTAQAGEASHLGHFTGTGVTCGFDARVTDDPPFNLSAGAAPYFVADFTLEQVWRTADGDTIRWSSDDGIFVQSLVDGSSSAIGTMVVTGGTGRFAGASGSARVVSSSAAPAKFDSAFVGSIVFDAAG